MATRTTQTIAFAIAMGLTLFGSPAQAQYERIVEQARPAVVLIAVETNKGIATGSGFFVDLRGYAMTARHVIEDAERIVVFLPDGRQLQAAVVRYSTIFDVAVIKVDGTGFPALRFADSDAIRQGQEILVLGYPFATSLGAESVTVTRGIVSAIRASEGLFQIDAALNPGNSGGPVLNLRSEVVGVAVARLRSGQAINFAVGGNLARTLTAELSSAAIPVPRSSVAQSPPVAPSVPGAPPSSISHPYWPSSEGARWEYSTLESPPGKRGRFVRVISSVERSDDRVVLTENVEEDRQSWSERMFITRRGVFHDSVTPLQGVARYTLPSPNLILPIPVTEGNAWETAYVVEESSATELVRETRRVARVGVPFSASVGAFTNCLQVIGSREILATQARGTARYAFITERVYCHDVGLVFWRVRELTGQYNYESSLSWYLIPR